MTRPVYLRQSCKHWHEDSFTEIFNQELAALDINQLPLQQGLSHSSVALKDKLRATILDKHDRESQLYVRAGLFYTGIISGCSCADDPSPQDEVTEYCEAVFSINPESAETRITLLVDADN